MEEMKTETGVLDDTAGETETAAPAGEASPMEGDAVYAAARARQEREVAAFFELFPEEELDHVPDEVWQRVKEGVSLSDGYAAYRIRQHRTEADAAAKNRYNGEHSSGAVFGALPGGFYSASQVAAMSEKEVRSHYDAIMDSMMSKTFYRD